jgi:hypothetical protein
MPATTTQSEKEKTKRWSMTTTAVVALLTGGFIGGGGATKWATSKAITLDDLRGELVSQLEPMRRDILELRAKNNVNESKIAAIEAEVRPQLAAILSKLYTMGEDVALMRGRFSRENDKAQ